MIDPCIGETDLQHPAGHKTTFWYQDAERGINVRLLVRPW
jgi:hypothetical protein